MTAKKRLVNYLKTKGVSQYEFSRRTGLSNGYLNSGENVTTANLDVITNIYGDLNLIWVVKGIGPMILTEEIKHLNYIAENTENPESILNEDYMSWASGDLNENPSSMTPEQLIQLNKVLKATIRAKDETIQAKNDKIETLEKLITEKENLNKIKDKLIEQLQQNQTQGKL